MQPVRGIFNSEGKSLLSGILINSLNCLSGDQHPGNYRGSDKRSEVEICLKYCHYNKALDRSKLQEVKKVWVFQFPISLVG